MATWYNKETRNEQDNFFGIRTIERPEGWENKKDNFTKIEPSVQCVLGHVACDWDEDTESWIIETTSQQGYDNQQTAIQAFRDSIFNNITIEDANAQIDQATTIAGLKVLMKKMVEFQIGMREVLREQINGN